MKGEKVGSGQTVMNGHDERKGRGQDEKHKGEPAKDPLTTLCRSYLLSRK